jgi:hypothetical protein
MTQVVSGARVTAALVEMKREPVYWGEARRGHRAPGLAAFSRAFAITAAFAEGQADVARHVIKTHCEPLFLDLHGIVVNGGERLPV